MTTEILGVQKFMLISVFYLINKYSQPMAIIIWEFLVFDGWAINLELKNPSLHCYFFWSGLPRLTFVSIGDQLRRPRTTVEQFFKILSLRGLDSPWNMLQKLQYTYGAKTPPWGKALGCKKISRIYNPRILGDWFHKISIRIESVKWF